MPAAVSKTFLVRFDNNKYSVSARAVGRPVDVHAYADRIVIRQDGRIVGEHPRSFRRGETIYDPWHYVPVLARKPGALRNGAPFKDWVFPAAMAQVRPKLAGSDDGDRQMVDILAAVLTDGLPAVEAACAEALAEAVYSADVILNILARRRDPVTPITILTPPSLRLQHEPVADCARRQFCGGRGDGTHRGMKAAFDEVFANGIKRRHEPQRIIGDLLKAELDDKAARSIKYQLAIAELPLAKELADLEFKGTPINETLVHDLATGCFIAHQRNIVGS